MSDIQRNLLIGLGIAGVLLLGGYLFIYKGSGAITTPNSDATTTVGGVSGTGSFTVEPAGVTPPSLEKPILFTASSTLTAEHKEILRTIMENIITQLKKEPTRIDLWLKLGTDRKIAGDYEGAIEAWEYVAQVAPKDASATAHGNLADLYMYFLKDFAKADTRYNQAISLNPKVLEYYRALFYLYRDIYKDTAKAEAIRALGIKNNPGTTDLQNLK